MGVEENVDEFLLIWLLESHEGGSVMHRRDGVEVVWKGDLDPHLHA